MKLILASNNAGKLREFREIFAGTDIAILSQAQAGVDIEADETGDTFEENAFLKASGVFAATKCGAVADDSGLCVKALNGAPGVHSARFGGGKAWTDRQKNEYLLQKLEGVENRRAKFVSCICCILTDGTVLRARGECPGRILTEPRGEGGFGYDPVFVPDGYGRSFAELGEEIKNRISHRARALAAFQAELERVHD
jgi:XTP/dITP diphosphohydrolase